MKNTTLLCACAVLPLLIIYSCKKNDAAAPDPCKGITVSTVATKTHTITGQQLGTITVTSPIGAEYTYSVNSTSFQPSVNFFNLAAGNYIVTAKTTAGCSDTMQLTINGYGPKFFAVRTLINGYCGPCHLNSTVNGGKNFDSDESIVNSWDRIKIRTVNGTPTYMPEGGQLTAADKQKIVDWVNAGHRVTD